MKERPELLKAFTESQANALIAYKETILRTQKDDFTGDVSPVPELHEQIHNMLIMGEGSEIEILPRQKTKIIYSLLLERVRQTGAPFFGTKKVAKDFVSELGHQRVVVTTRGDKDDESPMLEIQYKAGSERNDLHLRQTYTLTSEGKFMQLPYNPLLGKTVERERVIIQPTHKELSPIQDESFRVFGAIVEPFFDKPTEIIEFKGVK